MFTTDVPIDEPPAPGEIRYKILSADKRLFHMSEKALSQSVTLSQCVAGFADHPDMLEKLAEPIPVAHVNAETMEMVVRWCNKHKDDAPPALNERELIDPDDQDIPVWDARFLWIGNVELCNLLRAANYLDIKKLFDLVCKAISNMAVGKTPSQMREAFGMSEEGEQAAK